MIEKLMDYICNNIWSILQTFLSWLAIYLALQARTASQEQLKEMKQQFFDKNKLDWHIFRYKELSTMFNSMNHWEDSKFVQNAIKEWYMTQEQYDNIIRPMKNDYSKMSIKSLMYINKYLKENYPEDFLEDET